MIAASAVLTRELMTALAARDSGFRYTLVFDRPPAFDLPDNVEIIIADTHNTLNDAAVGDKSRSPGYLLKMGQVVRKGKNSTSFSFLRVYSYFPLLAGAPCVVCYHDTTAERIPTAFCFPLRSNRRLWQLKTALAKLQTARAMTVSQSSARDLEQILHIPKRKIDVVSEAADPTFRPIEDTQEIDAAKSKFNIPVDADYMMTLGGMNAHKNILSLLKAMPAIVENHPQVHLVIVGDISGKGFWDNCTGITKFHRRKSSPPVACPFHWIY